MVEVMEFKSCKEINEYLKENGVAEEFEIKPLARQFEHPKTHNIVNAISYILIRGYKK